MVEVVAFSPPAEVDFDAVTAPFWEGLRQGRLSVQRCANCGRFRTPPSLYCAHCRSTECEWPELSGRAVLYSYTVVALNRRESDSPVYVAALACPIEAPDTKLFCNVLECDPTTLAIGDELELVPAEAGRDILLFRPVSSMEGRP